MDRILITGPDSANKGIIASGMAAFKGVSPIGITTLTPGTQPDGDQVFVVYMEPAPDEAQVAQLKSDLAATIVVKVQAPV